MDYAAADPTSLNVLKQFWRRLRASKHPLAVPASVWIEMFSDLSEIPLVYTDKSVALQRITELVRQIMDSHACTLVLVDLARRVLMHAAGSGPNEAFERSMDQREARLKTVHEGGSLDFSVIERGDVFARYHLEGDGGGVANPRVAQRYGLSAALCFPLLSDGKVIGYLNHFSAVSRPFTTDEERLLGICAHQAVMTIEKFNQYQTRDLLANILHALSQSLLSMSLDDFFKEVSTKACELLKVSTCIVWTLDEAAQELTIASATDNVNEAYRQLHLSLTDPDTAAHLSRGKVAYLPEVRHPAKSYKHAEAAQERGWVSLLSAPMHIEERLVGVLDIYTHSPRSFPMWEQELFHTFANHAALALQQAQRRQETNALRERQRITEELHTVASSAFEDVLQRITNLCADALHAETCYVRLWNKVTDVLELKAYYDKIAQKPVNLEEYPLAVGTGIVGHVAREGQAYLCKDTENDPYYQGADPGPRLASTLCVPLKSGEEVIGTLSVGSRIKNAFRIPDVRFLENVTGSISMAIERAHLMDSLSRLAAMATQSASLEDILISIAKLARSLMRVPISVVWMLDKNRNGFVPKAFAGPDEQRETVSKLFMSNQRPELQSFLDSEMPIYCQDVTASSWRPYSHRVKALGWEAALSIRLCVEGRPIGFLEVYSRDRKRNFTQFHQGLFQTFTGQAAIAIDNVANRMRNEARSAITQELAESRDVETLLKILLEQGLTLVDSTRGWISRVDLSTGQRIVAYKDQPPKMLSLSPGIGITGKALQVEQPINVRDIQNTEWSKIYTASWKDTRSILAVPLVFKNVEARVGDTVQHRSMPLGVLNVESPTVNAFSRADEDILWSLARYASVLFGKLEFDARITKLSDAERRIADTQNGNDLIDTILSNVHETLGFAYVVVFLVDPWRNHVRAEYLVGFPDGEAKAFQKMAHYPLNDNSVYAAIARSRDIIVSLPGDHWSTVSIVPSAGKAQAVRVHVPMISSLDNRVMGIIEAGSQRGDRPYIYERDVGLLARFADCIARVLEQKDRGLLDRLRHEFTAPITGIRNNLSYLQRHITDMEPGYLQLKFDDMLMDCEILLHQVEELEYILGKTSRKSDSQETLVFRDIVIKTMNQLKPLVIAQGLNASKVSYRPTDAHKIRMSVDRRKLNQVVYNLLMNSIKYVDDDPEEFAIEVTADAMPDQFLLKFRDWGIGIKKGSEEKIFEKGFRTAEAIRRDVTGSGLGIPIAREIMREMGGDLLLANRCKPTEFHVILPKRIKGLADENIVRR